MKRLFIILGIILFFATGRVFAQTSVGIISDAILTQTNPYNYYYKTPDFIIQDISDLLRTDEKITLIPYSTTRETIKKKRLINNDDGCLRNIQNGYNLDFVHLKRIGNAIGAENIIVVTSSVEMQRDFLKNTLWNALNIGGYDVINPTHRINVYVALVNLEHEMVLWEGIYAKDIRNNKLRNLDTAISGNQEGLMRIKRYSKFISPDIVKNVRVSLGTITAKEKYETDVKGLIRVANKKVQIGSSKNLTNPDATFESLEAYKKAYDKKLEANRIQNEKNRARRAVEREKKRIQNEKNKAQKAKIKAKKQAEKEKLKQERQKQKELEKLQNNKNNLFDTEKGFNWFGLKKYM